MSVFSKKWSIPLIDKNIYLLLHSYLLTTDHHSKGLPKKKCEQFAAKVPSTSWNMTKLSALYLILTDLPQHTHAVITVRNDVHTFNSMALSQSHSWRAVHRSKDSQFPSQLKRLHQSNCVQKLTSHLNPSQTRSPRHLRYQYFINLQWQIYFNAPSTRTQRLIDQSGWRHAGVRSGWREPHRIH